MNSYTFNSDMVSDVCYRHWIVRFLATLICGLSVLYMMVLLCDPYSTGRFSLFSGIDMSISGLPFLNIGKASGAPF